MQNSLERLFEGMAASLRDAVLPAVSDAYARSQVRAAIEILDNLSTRVEWRHEQIEALVEHVAGALAASAIEPPARTGSPVADRRSHMAALAAAASADDPAEAIREAMLWELGQELERLRTGMYR